MFLGDKRNMRHEANFRKAISFLRNRLRIVNACRSGGTAETSKMQILCDQILDSVIVGGITGISAYFAAGESASLKSAVLAFLLTFLIKMKEYRKIK
jgi:hypothetical protein